MPSQWLPMDVIELERGVLAQSLAVLRELGLKPDDAPRQPGTRGDRPRHPGDEAERGSDDGDVPAW